MRDTQATPERIAQAESYYRQHYGIPDRPLHEALDSDYHTLSEELALQHTGLHPSRPLCSRNESGHKPPRRR